MTNEFTEACRAVIREQPQLAESVRAGKTGLAKLIGHVLKKVGAQDANAVARVMRKMLEEQ